jgi:hypothetical protein
VVVVRVVAPEVIPIHSLQVTITVQQGSSLAKIS